VSPVELTEWRRGVGVWDGVGEKQYLKDGDKAWSSINHAILSVPNAKALKTTNTVYRSVNKEKLNTADLFDSLGLYSMD